MSGITMLSALEIFNNPADIEIIVSEEKVSGKFAIGIFRGPGHNFKPILTSQPFAETKEDAVKEVDIILRSIHEVVTKEFENKESFASHYLNPDNKELDQAKVLNLGLISRILDELRQHQEVSTFTMFETGD